MLGKDVLTRLRDYVIAHIDEPIEVSTLAKIAGRSPFHFTRLFTRLIGVSPHRYVVHLRWQRAVELVMSDPAWPTSRCAQALPTKAISRVGSGAFTGFP